MKSSYNGLGHQKYQEPIFCNISRWTSITRKSLNRSWHKAIWLHRPEEQLMYSQYARYQGTQFTHHAVLAVWLEQVKCCNIGQLEERTNVQSLDYCDWMLTKRIIPLKIVRCQIEGTKGLEAFRHLAPLIGASLIECFSADFSLYLGWI